MQHLPGHVGVIELPVGFQNSLASSEYTEPGGKYVCTPDMGKPFHFTVFISLRQIPILQLTRNLGFSIPFHVYIHDQYTKEVVNTLICVVKKYVAQYQGFILYRAQSAR